MHEFSSYTVALAHERQHGETETKNPIRSPFHQLKCNNMAVYLHIHPKIWQDCIVWTLRLVWYSKALRLQTAEDHLTLLFMHICSALMPQSNLQFHQPNAWNVSMLGLHT